MFSWFLKLLGIDEDRPTASGNSYLDSSAKSANNNTTETTAAKAVEEPESQSEEVDTPAEVTDTSPEPEPEPEPEPASKSLSDEYPGLKANYVKVLEEAGFTTKAAIDKASDKDLLALKGIGKATLKIMRS